MELCKQEFISMCLLHRQPVALGLFSTHLQCLTSSYGLILHLVQCGVLHQSSAPEPHLHNRSLHKHKSVSNS